jgi:hypothetical protein
VADPRSRTDLRGLLEKAEAASPIEAVEVVADELAAMVGAHTVRFLIADLSGRSVVRFGDLAPGVAAVQLEGIEDAASVNLTGTVYERVLRTQQVDVRPTGNGALLTVPVTDRGEAIGLLELTLPQVPDEQVVADVAAAAMPSLTSWSRIAGTPICSSGVSARRTSPWPRRFSGGCCPPPTPVRQASSRSPAGWNQPAPSAGTLSTTASIVMRCRFRSPTLQDTR